MGDSGLTALDVVVVWCGVMWRASVCAQGPFSVTVFASLSAPAATTAQPQPQQATALKVFLPCTELLALRTAFPSAEGQRETVDCMRAVAKAIDRACSHCASLQCYEDSELYVPPLPHSLSLSLSCVVM